MQELDAEASTHDNQPSDVSIGVRVDDVSMELGLSKDQGICILNNINLLVARGEFISLVGPSGSGKSTLLGLIGGFDTPTAGDIYLLDVKISALSERHLAKIRNRLVGTVFQAFYLIPTLSALENVELPLYLAAEKDRGARARELLKLVGLENRLHHKPSQLSGGEQQRVAIARALACRPKILLADEPTGALDVKNGELIWDLLLKVRNEIGSTLIVATHNLELAREGDRIVRIIDGRLVKEV